MRLRGGRNKKGGFTLTEIVVSLFLLTVGIMAASSTLMTVYKGLRYSASLMTATNLAQSAMEDIKSQSYSQVQADTKDYGEISGYESFRRVTTVTSNAENTLKTVVVLVVSTNGQTISLETLVARK